MIDVVAMMMVAGLQCIVSGESLSQWLVVAKWISEQRYFSTEDLVDR
jgi:hypothetical protein